MPVTRSGCRASLRHRCRDTRAFSLVEILVVCALITTVASLAGVGYVAAMRSARIANAIGDVHEIGLRINAFREENGRNPDTLGEACQPVPIDPWGNPYVYTNLSDNKDRGKARKDGRLNPINSDYDLYSMGEDGRSATPLTAAHSRDDIVRARDGSFVGLASDF